MSKNEDRDRPAGSVAREGGERKRLHADDYEAIFDLSPDMIWVANSAGILLNVNPACTLALGFSREELVGSSWESFVHPDDIESIRQQVARQMEGHQVLNFANRYQTKDGGYRTLQWQGRLTDSGIYIGTARDITNQVRRAELLTVVALGERRKACLALHDGIAQQLFGLRMLASQLRDALKGDQPECSKRAGRMERATQEALGAVRDVIDGLLPFDGDGQNFVEALRMLCERIRTLFGIRCSLSRIDAVPEVDPDFGRQLFLIAQECVMNAVKHTDPKRIDIEIVRNGRYFSLVVTDDGHGIAESEARDIWGLGLMRDRALIINASIDVVNASIDVVPGETGGTVATCTWEANADS